ncbi:uncharacterized mitochondrial protein-like protein [Tanacetum coccineum]
MTICSFCMKNIVPKESLTCLIAKATLDEINCSGHQKTLVYVDDIIFGSTNKELCTGFEKLMKDKFQMSSMGELTFFLGLQVQQKEDGIFISQDKYVAEILKKFNYSDVKSASTPVDLEKPLVKDGDVDDVDLHSLLDLLLVFCCISLLRPVLVCSMCMCRFKRQPTLGLWYSKDSPFELVAYTDSDMLDQLKIGSLQLEVVSFLGKDLLTKGFDAGRFQYLVSIYVSAAEGAFLQALVDKKRVIVTESSIRRDLHLESWKLLKKWVRIQIIQLIPVKYLLLINHLHLPNPGRQNHLRRLRDRRHQRFLDRGQEHEERNVPTSSNDPHLVDAQAKEIAACFEEDGSEYGRRECQDLQGRSIANLDKDDDVTLVDETQDRQDDDLMFDTEVLDADEMLVEAIIKEAKPKVVTTATTTITTTRPKVRGVVVQDPSEFRVPQETQPSGLKIKEKKEQKLARKQEGEANIALIESWENTQAMMEADRLLSKRLQSKQIEELTDEEKGKLFMELMEKRRKHFAALRAQEKRRRTSYQGTKRNHYCRKKMLGMKRAGKEQQQESLKKQKVEKEKESGKVEEVDEIDEAELKKLLDVTRNRQRRLGSSLEDSEGKDYRVTIWKLIDSSGVHFVRVTIWKLIDSSGVHFVMFDNLHGFLEVTTT